MELHVRKVREVETGGMPTPIDRPILFEMGQSDVTFINKLSGNRLFNSIGVNKNYNKIELPLDVHDVF
jgi:hypothetical protein